MAIQAEDHIDIRSLKKRAATPVTADTAQPAAAAPAARKPVIGREITIRLQAVDPDTGEKLEAAVVSRVPDLDAKVQMARVESDLCGGRPFQSFAPERQAWMRRLARVTCQLLDPPEWVLNRAAVDDELLFGLSERCAAHELIFFRPGAASSGAAQSESELVIASELDRLMQPAAGPERPDPPSQ